MTNPIELAKKDTLNQLSGNLYVEYFYVEAASELEGNIVGLISFDSPHPQHTLEHLLPLLANATHTRYTISAIHVSGRSPMSFKHGVCRKAMCNVEICTKLHFA